MEYSYRTKGTCPSRIDFEIRDGRVYNVKFTGGCNGNLKAVSALVEGLTVEEVEKRVKGIRCGFKSTSCSDQLATALREAVDSENE